MKTKSRHEEDDDLRPEYNLKELLKKGVQGKYAQRCQEGTNLVLLAPDVAGIFSTEEEVNDALRLVAHLREIIGGKRKTAVKV